MIEYVSAKDIQRIHNDANPQHPISYCKARAIKEECKRRYEAENGPVFLYSEKLIPLVWYQTYFGVEGMTPRPPKKKKV